MVPVIRSEPAGNENYSIAIGYLRAAVIVVVVAVHSVLAYCSFAPRQVPFGAGADHWKAYPITDGRRWAGFDPIVGFTDPFGMSLLFFLSGLFVRSSLRRKGIARFGRDRAKRLGLPFAVVVALRAPAASYPTYLGPPPALILSRRSSDSGLRAANGRPDPHGSSGFCWCSITSPRDCS